VSTSAAVTGAGRLASALTTARAELGPEVELQNVLTLLLVAANPGIGMADLQRELALSSAAMSRNVSKLTGDGYKVAGGKVTEGLELVAAFENPLDRRAKMVRLTPKGRTLVNKMVRHLKLNAED
jgi:DNA-binding MarR family transcriptional regulator